MKDMTNNEFYLADTYAWLEIIKGNEQYLRFTNEYLITTQYNLIELYFILLKDYGREIAELYLETYKKNVRGMTYTAIKQGMGFKLKHQKERLSYCDCVGYALARELGIKFLTGDQKFVEKENVEFVK